MATENKPEPPKGPNSTVTASAPKSSRGAVFAPITKNQEEKAEALNRTRNTEEKSQKGEKPEVSKEKKNAEDRSSRKIIAAKKEKKESPRRRGRRAGRDGHSAVKRRRAVVYHDDGQAGAPDIHGGRRGSSGSVDDYVKGDRGSSSDEYKRRVHEIREKYREEKAAEEEDSKNLQKIVAAVLALIILVMLTILIVYSQMRDDVRRLIQPKVQHLEVLRYKYGVMSEDLDCSVHMKRRYTLGDTPHDVVRQGLMCLYALAPHTVHEESSVQLIFVHAQTQLGMVEAIENMRLQAICNTSIDTRHCRLREIWRLVTGFFYSKGKLRNSRLSSVWFEPEHVDEQRHAAIWSRSFWKDVKYGSGTGMVKERKFRIPSLLIKLANSTPHSEKLLSHWQKRFPYINVKKMSTKDSITITQKEADLAASIFGSNKAKKTRVGRPLRYYELERDESRQHRLDIVFPKLGENGTKTLSFMTAFIIKVVYAAFNEVDPLDRENSLTVMSLNAQTIALQLLRRTQEWTGDKTDPSLLAYDKKAIDQIIKQTYDRGPVKITRNATDRVTSILTWEANKLVDAVLMMELSLPHIFDPTGGTGKRVEYAPFVHENGEKSIQFSSTAGVMIVQTTRGVPKALMAASASGSERTVEGVANAILRMLILKKGAGVAVGTLDAYVDHKDGRSHCTHSVSETLKFLFNYKCDSHDHQKPKRTIMAAEAGSQAPQITLALSQEFGGYNYASGY